MNEKGQTLVLFLFLLPVLLLLFICVYQIGNLELEKKKMMGALKETVSYGLKNQESETLKEDMIGMLQISFPELSEENITIDFLEEGISMQIEKEYSVALIGRQKLKISYMGEK